MENQKPEDVSTLDEETEKPIVSTNKEESQEDHKEQEKRLDELVRLKEENEKLRAQVADIAEKNVSGVIDLPKAHEKFKVGEVVEVLPKYGEWTPGRIIEVNKSVVIVGTAKGEITLSPQAAGKLRNIE